jgi:hypothetical protein
MLSIHNDIGWQTYVDDASRRVVAQTLRAKADIPIGMMEFTAWSERLTGNKLQIMRCDGAPEVVKGRGREFFDSKGIGLEVSPPYRQAYNGTAEVNGKYLWWKALPALVDSKLPKRLWPYFVRHAAKIHNTLPGPDGKAPFELFDRCPLPLAKLRVMGCAVFRHLPKASRSKLSLKASLGAYLGYDEGAFLVYDLQSHTVTRSKDIVVDETRMAVDVAGMDADFLDIVVEFSTGEKYDMATYMDLPDARNGAESVLDPLQMDDIGDISTQVRQLDIEAEEDSSTASQIAAHAGTRAHGSRGAQALSFAGAGSHWEPPTGKRFRQPKAGVAPVHKLDHQSYRVNEDDMLTIKEKFAEDVVQPFAVDVFSSNINTWATTHWTPMDDGFSKSWDPELGLLLVNGDFRKMEAIVDKAIRDGADAVIIGPWEPDAPWQRKLAAAAEPAPLVFDSRADSFLPDVTGNIRSVGYPPFSKWAAWRLLPRQQTTRGLQGIATSPGPVDEKDVFTLAQARKSVHWPKFQAALTRELANLIEHGSFEPLDVLPPDFPAGSRPLPSTCIFQLKRDKMNVIYDWKARWCVMGNHQRPGQDFATAAVSAPTISITSLRLILSVACAAGDFCGLFDISGAFLNGTLRETVIVQTPTEMQDAAHELLARASVGEGVRNTTQMMTPEEWVSAVREAVGRGSRWWRLRRPVYGLRQAGFEWYRFMRKALRDLGFHPTVFDCCVYVHWCAGDLRPEIVGMHVDDGIVITRTEARYSELMTLLDSIVETRAIGCADGKMFNGLLIEYSREKKQLYISQQRYITSYLVEKKMQDAHGKDVPHAPGLVLTPPALAPASANVRHVEYNLAADTGLFGYLATGSRPDLAERTGKISQLQAKPTNHAKVAAEHVARYLKSTQDWRLCLSARYDGTGALTLRGGVDADLAGEAQDMRSTSGYYHTVGGVMIQWTSQLQRSAINSSTVAELAALSQAQQVTRWLRRGLQELGHRQTGPTVLQEDNTGCVDMARAPTGTKKTRMVPLMSAVVRDALDGGHVEIAWISTEDQIADIFTKGLPVERHRRFCTAMGLGKRNQLDKTQK